jgi:hypothetical protein
MDAPLESEIDKIAQEMDRLRKDGDPQGRLPDLGAYLRVLTAKLAMTLQQDPERWRDKSG